jgi:hypothetical protein
MAQHMSGAPKLTVEIIPTYLHGKNPRTVMGKAAWGRHRKRVCEAAGNRCELCGGVGKRHPVEIHESYEYDETSRPPCQKVVGLIALCPIATRSSIWLEHGWWRGRWAIRRSTKTHSATSPDPAAADVGFDAALDSAHPHAPWISHHAPRFRTSAATTTTTFTSASSRQCCVARIGVAFATR